MVSGNFCQLTCGHCPAACSGGSATPPSAAGTVAATGTGASPPMQGATPPTGATPSFAHMDKCASSLDVTSVPDLRSSPPHSQNQGAGQTPPQGTSTPPSTATGSVQTFSVEASPPPATPPSGGGCTDNPPPNANGQTCPQLVRPAIFCHLHLGNSPSWETLSPCIAQLHQWL